MSKRARLRPKSVPSPSTLARGALFVVYVWFGLLKVLGLSPATGLVQALQLETLPFLDFASFLVFYGVFEVVIGALFLFPRATRPALALLVAHVMTTLLPLFVLPEVAWQRFLVPTLEGQYIIKNLLLIAAAATLLPAARRPALTAVVDDSAKTSSVAHFP